MPVRASGEVFAVCDLCRMYKRSVWCHESSLNAHDLERRSVVMWGTVVCSRLGLPMWPLAAQ